MEIVEGVKRGVVYYIFDNFVYNKKGKFNDALYLECTKRNCRARAVLDDSNFRPRQRHNHERVVEECDALRFREKLMTETTNSSEPLKKIYDEVAEHYPNAAIGYSYKSAESRMRRKRKEVKPPTPRNLTMLGDFLAHFEPDQFEKKIPGKLKPNAIPTIFSHFPQPKHSKSSKKRQQDISHYSDVNNQPAKVACVEHSYSTHSSVHVTEESGEDSLTPVIDEQCPQETAYTLSESELVFTLKANLEDAKRKLREVERQKESLEKKYSTLFNSDQIAFMESGVMQPKISWSDDTVRKALQLRFSCGFGGYSMLLAHGFPLPSDTTLQRRLGKIPLNDDDIPEVMNMPKLKDSSPANNASMSPCIKNENSVQEKESNLRHPVHGQTTTTTTTRPIIQKLKPTRTTLPFTSPQAKARTDEFKAIGMNVTEELRKMSFTQRSIVKSLIIKMLARGVSEELTEDTDLVTITNYYEYNNSPDNSNSASNEDLSNCEVYIHEE